MRNKNFKQLFKIQDIVAKDNYFKSWTDMRNNYLTCKGQIPDKIIDDLAFAYAEEYHQSELLKLNKSDVISSVCKCKGGAVGRNVTADFEHQICDKCGNIAN